LVSKREDPEWKSFYDYAFGKRLGEELYDLARDPDQTHNLAQEPEFAAVKARLSEQLLKVLTEARDPRVINGGTAFDKPPFTDRE
jgi:uncharacterized sulfatase